MSSLLKVRPDGWKCESCRYFEKTKHNRYDGVCLLEPKGRSDGQKGLAGNFREHMRDDWCMQYEAEKQAATGKQIGLLDLGGSVGDKTGGDR